MRVTVRIIGVLFILAGGLVIVFHYTGEKQPRWQIEGCTLYRKVIYTGGPLIGHQRMECDIEHLPPQEKEMVPSPYIKGTFGVRWGMKELLYGGAVAIAIGLFTLIATFINHNGDFYQSRKASNNNQGDGQGKSPS